MRILIIPANDWIFGPKQYFHDLAEILAEKHDVFVWHFNLFRDTKPCVQKLGKVKLIRPISVYSDSALIYYAANFILHSLSFVRTVRKLRIDTVVILNLVPALWAFPLAPSKTLKVFGFEDYYPESTSLYFKSSILSRVVKGLALIANRLGVRLADLILSPCFSLINVSEKMGGKRNFFLPNGVDSSFFTPSKYDKSLAAKLGLSEHTIVFYGLIECWLDFDTVTDGFRLLKKEIPDVKLLIIGSTLTGYTDELRKTLQQKELINDVILTGYVPEQLVPYYLNLGSVCLMPYRQDTFSGKIRLPLKLFIYSAMAKPILSVPLPEVKRFRPKHVFFYHDKKSFADLAKTILTDEKLRNDVGSHARRFAVAFDYAKIAEKCNLILEENLLKKRKQQFH